MVQEKLQTMEGFQEEQQEAPTDAYLTDDGTSYVIVPETETYMIQELHLPVYHALCLMLEERFF